MSVRARRAPGAYRFGHRLSRRSGRNNGTVAGVSELITFYDILGVPGGAAADTLRRAHDDRLRQLRLDLVTGAPSPVVSAVSRARDTVETAWLVLGDPGRRARYDREVGLARGDGLRGSRGFAEGAVAYGGDPYHLLRAGERLLDGHVVGAGQALLTWMAPLPTAPRRRLVVPDLRGMFFRPGLAVATMAGLRLAVVKLTPDPLPVEGLVVTQSPGPGATARLQSVLTVQVWHPARSG